MRSHHVSPSRLQGTLTIPSSKSQTLRALLFAFLASGKSTVKFPLASPDTEAMIQACRSLGGTFRQQTNAIEVEGVGGRPVRADNVIDAGNSGIVLRFCSAVGALAQHPVVITGDRSIRYQRPMRPLLHALAQLGASALSMRGDGYAPVIIQGPITGGVAVLEGKDSQFVSALLIAATCIEKPLTLHVKQSGELPWVAMTLDWLQQLGVACEHENFSVYQLRGCAGFKGFHYSVPGDFSSAAFPLAAALITGSEITLANLDIDDVQGDKKLLEIVQAMGADLVIDRAARQVHIKACGALRGIEIDVNPVIDAVPILAVLGTFAEGTTTLYNGAVARCKESDRINVICSELRKMGAQMEERQDGMVIHHSPLRGAVVESHHDHRIGMSLAVAGMGASGKTIVQDVDCIAKSYPDFLVSFQKLGAAIA